ncbi:uncharacterized protein LOC118776449 [Megalops cyprinoides]|uniref:uncharacterized protein LOC118776449 n=1 Tax=Megalops cyprinoides TaxID=118141 RepID=UPI0018652053|nr:uncharacterized protein LOC118776449 [Megalops cyprinoides]
MARQPQVWSVTLSVWTAVIAHSLQSLNALQTQYPVLNETELLLCECKEKGCQAVFWYWQPSSRPSDFRFLFYYNNADKVTYGPAINQTKYKGSRKDGVRVNYLLKISSIQKSDAGFYSCLIQYSNRNELGSPGIKLRPGEKAPTPPPPPKPPKTLPPCRCRNRVIRRDPQGCGRLVLWPLVGVLMCLAVVLISTLYYFSRLPKKCHHRLVK